jgi:transcriptional regulator with XRE-family HTH domain
MEAEVQSEEKKTPHLGRNTQRIREMIGMKQSTLAANTGYSQQYISKLERSETFTDEVLEKVANGLGVKPNVIREFDEEAAINYINNFNDNSVNHGPLNNYHCVFNPIDKIVELVDKNETLYEALLKSEQDKITLLQEQIQLLKSKS